MTALLCCITMSVLASCIDESPGPPASEPSQVGAVRPFAGRYLEAVPYAAGGLLDAYVPAPRPTHSDDASGLPVIVLIHGCCGDRSDLAKLAEAIASAGAVVFNVGWPGMDGDAHFPESYEAVDCGVRFARARARDLGGDADHIVLAGWSDGAMVAAVVAAAGKRFGAQWCPYRRRAAQPSAVVGINGFYGWTLPVSRQYVTTRARAFFRGTSSSVPGAWATATPYAWLSSAPAGGTLLLVGSTDPLAGDARRYQAALRGADRPVRLVELPPAGDQTLISPRSPEGRRVVAEILSLGRRVAAHLATR